MIISHISIRNWKNFLKADLALQNRVFLVGPNASGKSNFLDVFRFLRDLAKPKNGGLQEAVGDRGGISKIRCLAARKNPRIEIKARFTGDAGDTWRYEIGIDQEQRKLHRPKLAYEAVFKNDVQIVNRPNADDKKDPERLTQTFLQQTNANYEFREIVLHLSKIQYLHLVPQLLKFPALSSAQENGEDPFGRKFLETVARTPERNQRSKLKKIEKILNIVVPELKKLTFERDERGMPHLAAVYKHWRAHGGKQREDQFSDGTLRILGLLWLLLQTDALLLLEEPELSLHASIVRQLAPLMWHFQKLNGRQILVSTHSVDLLSNQGIAAEEVVLLRPQGQEGTEVQSACAFREIKNLMQAGLSLADAILPFTAPAKMDQLQLSLPLK
ncbi:MAG: AAA family ATPase [Verrucomicrobiota bacterium]